MAARRRRRRRMVAGPGGHVPHGLRRALPRGGAGHRRAGRRRSGSTATRSRTASSRPSWPPRATSPSPSGRSTPARLPRRARRRTSSPARSCSRHARPGRPAPPEPVVDVDARRGWRSPKGPARRSRAGRTIPSCTSPTRTRRPTPRGRASACRRRPSGSSPRAAGSTAPPTSGATSRSRPASGSPTTGTATFPWRLGSRLRDDGAGRLVPAERLRPLRHGRQRLGVDDRLVHRPPSGGRAAALLRPSRPRGRDPRGQPRPRAAAVPGPAQGRQGRLVPVRRQLLPALPAGGAAPADDRHGHEPRRLPLRAED